MSMPIVADWPTTWTEQYPEGLHTPASWDTPAGLLADVGREEEDGPTTQVVIVGPGLAGRWRLPATLDAGNPIEWPAPAAGWSSGPAGPWVTFVRDHHRVHVAVWPWLRQGRYPDRDHPLFAGLLADPAPDQTAVRDRLRAWRAWFGIDYRGTPGVAALAVLRDLYPPSRPPHPLWHLPPVPALELAHEPELYWRRPRRLPGESGRFLHTYDRVKAYLAAEATVEVAAGPLSWRGHTAFTPDRCGWWRIDADYWPHGDRIPDPLHDLHDLRGVWVTTPTAALLTDLAASGLYGGFTVLESWTGPKTRLLRGWAEKIRDALAVTSGVPEATAQAMTTTLKASYRAAYGLLGRKGGGIYRPDWHHAIVAQSRTTCWRQAWRIGQATGRWPASVRVDGWTYVSELEDPARANPGFALGERLGGWRVSGTTTITPPTRGRTRAKAQ